MWGLVLLAVGVAGHFYGACFEPQGDLSVGTTVSYALVTNHPSTELNVPDQFVGNLYLNGALYHSWTGVPDMVYSSTPPFPSCPSADFTFWHSMSAASLDAGIYQFQFISIAGSNSPLLLGPVVTDFDDPPSVSSLSVYTGPQGGGTTVVIYGSGFGTPFSYCDVLMSGTSAASCNHISSTQISFVTAAGVPGTYQLRVLTPRGVALSSPDFWSYNAAPSISNVIPVSGSESGMYFISIYGSGFSGTPSVLLGGSTCSDASYISTQVIECYAPPGAPGPASVVVTTALSGSSGTIHGYFDYEADMTVDYASPDESPLSGGRLILIFGSNFPPSATAYVGGKACVFSDVLCSSVLECITPSFPNTGWKGVHVASSTSSSAVLPTVVYYNSIPVITSVLPSSGPVAGGTTITIRGSSFGTESATSLRFDGVPCDDYSYMSSTEVWCLSSPAAPAPGTVPVIMTTEAAGTSAAAYLYSYRAVPVITDITPQEGPLHGGTIVTIRGTNLPTDSSPDVHIGGKVCNLEAYNSFEIECRTAPFSGAGNRIVYVDSDETGEGSFSAFKVLNPPILLAVNPSNGPMDGGQTITITGAISGTFGTEPSVVSVALGGVLCMEAELISDVEIECVTGIFSYSGDQLADVYTDAAGSTSASGVYYANERADVIDASPNSASQTGGQIIVIGGFNFFEEGFTIYINDTPCVESTFVSDFTGHCRLPSFPSFGPATVSVYSDLGGMSGMSLGVFALNEANGLLGISVPEGPVAGSTYVEILGRDFGGESTVINGITFDGVPATDPTYISQTLVSCVTPPGTSGSADVVVDSSEVGLSPPSPLFKYNDRPVVQFVEPSTGPLAGGQLVQVWLDTSTSGFGGIENDVQVLFNELLCTNVTWLSRHKVTCIHPPRSTAGPVNVAVSSEYAAGSVNSVLYTYNNPPVVTRISPMYSPETGGTWVTIRGTGFGFGVVNSVTFDGAPCTSVVGGAFITCRVPPGSAGTPTVVVDLMETGVNTTVGMFVYSPPPVVTSVEPVEGPSSGGTAVTIRGANFGEDSGTALLAAFGESVCDPVVWLDPSTIVCTTTLSAPGSVTLNLLSTYTGETAVENAFLYNSAPEIEGFNQTEGPYGGGSHVGISGRGFGGVSNSVNISIGTVPCVVSSWISPTFVYCLTAPNTVGALDVTVRTTLTGKTVFPGAFLSSPSPDITSASVSAGSETGGSLILFGGTNFGSYDGGVAIVVGSTPCTQSSWLNPTTIACLTAPACCGTGLQGIVVNLVLTGTSEPAFLFSYSEAQLSAAHLQNVGMVPAGPMILNVICYDQYAVEFSPEGGVSAEVYRFGSSEGVLDSLSVEVPSERGLFDLPTTITVPGKYRMRVWDTEAGDSVAFNVTFDVGPGVLDHTNFLESTDPITIFAGEALTFTVRAQDAYGNGIITDPPSWSAVLNNGAGVVLVLPASLFAPQINPLYVDASSMEIETAGTFALVVQLDGVAAAFELQVVVLPLTVSDVGNTVVFGGECGIASDEDISIQMRDVYGNNRDSGGDTVEVRQVESGSEDWWDVDVRYDSNGRYFASILGWIVGEYDIEIMVNGVEVLASPFACQVTPAPTSGPNCSAAGDGVVISRAGNVMDILIIARDRFGNNRTSGGDTFVIQYIRKGQLQLAANDNHDGTYSSSYVGDDEGGSLVLDISFGASDIDGSPFNVDVLGRCTPGFFSPNLRSACSPCEKGFFTDQENSLSCQPCPENTLSNGAASSVLNCTCVPGFFTRQRGQGCSTCPAGGFCSGGINSPTTSRGYFPSETDSDTFVQCPLEEACLGGQPFRCAEGYDGYLCTSCQSAYYTLNGRCKPCTSNTGGLLFLLFLGLWTFCGIVYWVNTKDRDENKFAVLFIAFNTFQIVALYGFMDINWPPASRGLIDVLSLFNFKIELASPECAVSSGNFYLFKWYLMMFLPIIAAGMFACWFGLFYLRHLFAKKHGRAFEEKFPDFCAPPKTRGGVVRYAVASTFFQPGKDIKGLRNTGTRAFYHCLVFFFLPLSSEALTYFACYGTDGKFLIKSSSTMECYTKEYWSHFASAIIFNLLYTVGIPVFIFAILSYKLKSLDPIKFRLRYGFLVSRYTDDNIRWEVAIVLRKLLIVMAVLFFDNTHNIQLFLAVLALCGCFYAQNFRQPFISPHHNTTENLCIASAMFSFFVALGLQNTGATILFDFLIVTTILATALMLAVVFARDVHMYLKERAAAEEELFEYEAEHSMEARDSGMSVATYNNVATTPESTNMAEMNSMNSVSNSMANSMSPDPRASGYGQHDSYLDLPEEHSSQGSYLHSRSSETPLVAPPPPAPEITSLSTQLESIENNTLHSTSRFQSTGEFQSVSSPDKRSPPTPPPKKK